MILVASMASTSAQVQVEVVPFVEPTPPIPTEECADKACVEALIRHYSKVYKVNADYALAIARCESELKHTAVGDNGLAYGVYQFHRPTFALFEKKMRRTGELMENESLDYKSTDDNVRMALWAFQNDKDHHWTCARKVAVVK